MSLAGRLRFSFVFGIGLGLARPDYPLAAVCALGLGACAMTVTHERKANRALAEKLSNVIQART